GVGQQRPLDQRDVQQSYRWIQHEVGIPAAMDGIRILGHAQEDPIHRSEIARHSRAHQGGEGRRIGAVMARIPTPRYTPRANTRVTGKQPGSAMTVRRSHRGRWMIDIQITMPDGSITRIRKVSPVPTRRGAENYEREVRAAVLEGTRSSKEEEQAPAVPTLASFAAYFIDTYATTNNRPSTVREKRRTLGRGMLAQLGRLRLDQIGPRHIEAFKARRKKDGVGNKTI